MLEIMGIHTFKGWTKKVISVILSVALLLSTSPGVFSVAPDGAGAAVVTGTSGSISCRIKFSKPAICCDAGQVINLTQCGVQFSASSMTVTDGITWTYEGQTVTSFTPPAKGVYALTAAAGGSSKTVYVVAKNPAESEYVLYRNDFAAAVSDYRVPERSNGGKASVSGGCYILDASADKNAYVRVLLPQFLDAFGDMKLEASLKITSAVDAKKWGSMMFRVQGDSIPYYQACFRYGITASNGVEISQKNSSDEWEVYRKASFSQWNTDDFNICTVTVKGTEAVLNINSYDVLSYGNVGLSNGAMGFQARASKLQVDYVQVTLEGNEPVTTSADVSFTKPAIRADMGDTIDLTACDVQFKVNALYTKGSQITWTLDGQSITSFTPAQAGVTVLTATGGGVTKNIYVVTRNLTDSEYVLYRNDFDEEPTDFRVIQEKNNGKASYDGKGHYILDASHQNTSYCRVLLPEFLDEFGDFKYEARFKDTKPNTERNWGSLMARVQNGDFPYMQFCARSDATQEDGVEISQRTKNDDWDVKNATSFDDKTAGAYNTYTLVMQSHRAWGYINGEQVIYYAQTPYATGAFGLQAKGLKITVDYVKITLGDNAAWEDTAVKTLVNNARPAIGCNAGQTVLLSECDVQFVHGSPAVDASQITWKKDGKIITEFSDTSTGVHKLTATHAGNTMDIYVVAKKTTAYEYVLYTNSFDSAPTDFRVVQASNGGTYGQSDGKYYLDGSGNKDSYVRILLPSWLDAFGDAALHASFRLSKAVDAKKWGSVMFRVQNGNYPYNHALVRYDAKAENGVELAQRNASNEWEVYKKAAMASYTVGGWHEIYVSAYGTSTDMYIAGSRVLSYTDMPYHSGAWGFQVRAARMELDWIRVLFTKNATYKDLYVVKGKYADVRDPDTQIQIAPALITDVKTRADFENILTGSPAVAILNYKIVDGAARVVFNDGSVSPLEAVQKLAGRVIPAFRIDNNDAADSLASFLIGQDMQDAYAVSTTPSVVKRAYQKWKYIRGVVDYSGRTGFDGEDLRYEALANAAKVLILPENTSKAQVTGIQDSFSCVWLTVSAGKTASVTATNKGPYGIITPNRAVTEECYKNLYKTNTMIRRPNVIGHRGNPSTSQENTIAGFKTAYSYGATAVETDFYRVSDGVLMIMHDATIDRTTNGSGKTVNFTSTQLKSYVVDVKSGIATQPIPSVEELFKLVKGNKDMRLVMEIKHPNTDYVSTFINLIKKYDVMDQMVIIDFDKNNCNISAMRKQLPGVPFGWLNYATIEDAKPMESVQAALEQFQSNLTGCNPKYTGFGEISIREFAYRGLTIWPWTLRDQPGFDKLMIDGVGGITTDYSQWASNYIEELQFNSSGKVIAKTYAGASTDVTNKAEFVLIEDTIGISWSNGKLNVPLKKNGGTASFFFRLKSTNPSGTTYYTVTEVVTIIDECATKGHDYVPSITVQPGCLTNGERTYTCSRCYDSYTEPVAPVGHSHQPVVTAPGCIVGGYTTYVCACGDSYVTDHTPAAGHSYERYVCTVCGDVQNITVYFDNAVKGWQSVNAHYWNTAGATTQWPGVAMTPVGGTVYSVTFPGDMTGIIFNNGSYQTEDLTIPGDGYIHDGYQWKPYGEALTTAFYVSGGTEALGNWEAAAAHCLMTNQGGGNYSVTLYNLSAGTYEYKITDGTWDRSWGKDAGNFAFSIKAPSNVTVRFNVNTNNSSVSVQCLHSYTAEVTAPTCTEGGYTTYTCICGSCYVGNETAATGHSYQAAVTPVTCTQDGCTTYTCHCGDSYVADHVPATGHSHQAVVTPVTCTQDGYTTYTCHCGDSYATDVLPATGHSYSVEVTTSPGCDSAGARIYTCTVCAYSYTESIAATGHNYTVTVTAPTCETDGYTVHACPCGYSYETDRILAYGHTVEYIPGHDVSCTQDGLTEGQICTTCEKVLVEQELLPALGHNYCGVTVGPTCTEDGYLTMSCDRCGYSYVEAGEPSTGHSYEDYVCSGCGDVIWVTVYFDNSIKQWKNVNVYYWNDDQLAMDWPGIAMTAVEDNVYSVSIPGNMPRVIFNDGSSQTDDLSVPGDGYITDGYSWVPYGKELDTAFYVSGSGDALGNWAEAPEAGRMTWQGSGIFAVTLKNVPVGDYEFKITDGTWDRCWGINDGNVTFKVLAPSNVTVEFNTNTEYIMVSLQCLHSYTAVVTEPTCVDGGYTTYTCVCGHSYEDHQIPALGHSYEQDITAPTCTEGGFTVFTCHCGDTYVGDETAATGHLYKASVTDPTCTADGYTTYTCHCGESYTGNETGALGHRYDSGELTVEPGCDTQGTWIYTCYGCGLTYTKAIAATGHTYVAQVTAPTCTVGGDTTYTCTACGDHYTEETDALGHRYTAAVTAPTCTAEGYTTYTCTVCAYSYRADPVSTVAHSYQDGICAACGDVQTYTVYFNAGVKGWTAVSIYAQSMDAQWPGVSMTPVSNGVYSVKVPATMSTIIFNDGTYQTQELTVPGDGYVCDGYNWAPYGKDCGTAFYVTGISNAADDWDAAPSKGLMTNLGGGSFSVTFSAVPAGTYDYTVTDGTWDRYWAGESVTVSAPTDVTVKFNVNTNTATVSMNCLHSYQAVVTAPTCTKGGFTSYICACGSSYTADQRPALGHGHSVGLIYENRGDGYHNVTCGDCGVITDSQPHSYGSGKYVCACGASYNGFRYEEGGWYYYVGGVRSFAGLIYCDGPQGNDRGYYYINSKGKLITGCNYRISKTNGYVESGTYQFDENGTMYTVAIQQKNGFVYEDGSWYYYVSGSRSYAGLIYSTGPQGNASGYYYVNSHGEVITDSGYWVSKTNGLMGAGYYTFDANGKLIQS